MPAVARMACSLALLSLMSCGGYQQQEIVQRGGMRTAAQTSAAQTSKQEAVQEAAIQDQVIVISRPQRPCRPITPPYDIDTIVYDMLADPANPETIINGAVPDASKISVTYAGPVTQSCNLGSSGSCMVTGLPAGTYKRIVAASDGSIISHADLGIQPSCSQEEDYVVAMGSKNRFNYNIDGTFVTFLSNYMQRVQFPGDCVPCVGTVRWNANNLPKSIIFDNSASIPQACMSQLKTFYANYSADALKTYYGNTIQSLPMSDGQIADYSLFVTFDTDTNLGGAGAITDFPKMNGKEPVQARTRWNQSQVCQALGVNADISSAVYHEIGRTPGIPNFSGINVYSNMTNDAQWYVQRPSTADKAASTIMYHIHTKAGNKPTADAQMTNPQ